MPKATIGVDQETDYEKVRKQNMQSNQKLLVELMGKQMDLPAGLAAGFAVLGIDEPKPKPKAKKAPKPKAPKPKVEKEDEEVEREGRGSRRSARQASKPAVSYAGDGDKIVDKSKMPRMVSRPDKHWDEDDSDEDEDGERKERVNKLVGRVHDPKTFGLIPGVPIGSWWETRAECSAAAIHAPFVAGISGGPEGAYSVALSGGYDDDIDMGDAFTYTGSGGRDLKGTAKNPKNLRTAPQSSHQSFEHSFNKALKISAETRKPVRVIRGYKLPGVYAPESGYRYDGLYIVERAWMDRGNNPKGWKVCKFAFRRIPGQPPIPKKGEKSTPAQGEDVEMEDAEEEKGEEEEESEGEEEEEGKSEAEGGREEESEAEGEEEVDGEEEKEEEPEEKPKRKPGRPPKSKGKVAPKPKSKVKEEPEEEKEEDEPEEEEEKPAPAKRGRKPKPKVKEEPEQEPVEEKPKRGRKPGRKSQVSVKAEEEEPEEVEEEEEEEPEPEEKPAPAKRGRKPKAQSEPESEPAPKRGRKPKARSEPEEEDEEESTPPAKKSKVEEAPKRKRGRPPKKQQ